MSEASTYQTGISFQTCSDCNGTGWFSPPPLSFASTFGRNRCYCCQGTGKHMVVSPPSLTITYKVKSVVTDEMVTRAAAAYRAYDPGHRWTIESAMRVVLTAALEAE